MKYFSLTALLAIALLSVFGCDSTAHQGSLVQLDLRIPDRQRLAVALDQMQVEVVVNDGEVQRFVVSAQQSPTVQLQGIRLGEMNTIRIKWSELLNGYVVELSEQNQEFFAGENIVVDAEHTSSQFDNDNDGVSNLDERINSTCVWQADNGCFVNGGLDVPPGEVPQPTLNGEDVLVTPLLASTGVIVPSTAVDSASEVVLSDDFSNGTDSWQALDGTTGADSTLCIPLQSGVVGSQDILVYYIPELTLNPGAYIVQFDVRASRLAPVAVAVTVGPPAFSAVVDHFVQGTTEWQTHTLRFRVNENSTGRTIGFNAFRSALETTYCLDNIKLVRI